MQDSMFASHTQAINTLTPMLLRLVSVMGWALLWLAHLTLVVLVLLVLWLTGTTPADIGSALHALQQSTSVQWLTALGFSALGAMAAYVWLAKRIHRYVTREWLLGYLSRPR